MPSSKPRVPSYCHHRASGQAVVRIAGRDVYLGPYNSEESKAEYDRRVAEWMIQRRTPVLAAGKVPDDLTVNELLEYYLQHAEVYYSKNGEPTQEVTNIKHATTPLCFLYGVTPVREFGPSKLKTVRQAMINDNLCRGVVNSRINRIRRIFKWGVENEVVPPSVLHGLQAVSGLKRGRSEARETEPVKPVPDEHVEAVIRVVPPTLAAMIRLQWLTGMRPGELVIMRGCDLDKSGDVWIYKPAHHKTEHFGHEREIPMGPQAQQLIKPRLKKDLSAFIFSPRDVLAERYAARDTHRRKPNIVRKTKRKVQTRYSRVSYARAIEYACKTAKVPHWSPHRLRHAAATRLRKEFGLDVAQVILGHKCAEITQIYAQLNKTKAVEVMRTSG